MAKVLIIEDDVTLAASLQEWFKLQGHRSEVVHDGKDGLELLKGSGYELALIDWQLPGMDGIDIISKYRQTGGRVPILMLTQKSSINDKCVGLESGADDYLPKPFDMRELAMRVNAMLRRASGLFTNKREIRGLVLDRGACAVVINERTVKLMKREFELLEFLLRHPDNYFSPDQLLDNVWGSESHAGLEALRVCINRLRNRVDVEGEPSIIETSKGWGYKISDKFVVSVEQGGKQETAT
jgi:two-component system phosphate regulon response regulator PhoB